MNWMGVWFCGRRRDFLLDFFVGSMAHDCEAYGCRYRDSSPPSSPDDDAVSILALCWASKRYS